MQEGYSDRPFHLPESREWVSHVKAVPPASGCRKTPLTLEVENLKLKNLCEQTCYSSDLLPQVQTLFRFFTNCAQSFIALSLPTNLVFLCPESIKAPCFGHFLGPISMGTLASKIKMCFFSSHSSVFCRLHDLSSHKNSREVEREVSSPPWQPDC